MKYLWIAGGAVITAAAALFLNASQAAGLLPYEDEEAVAAGARLYEENCAACHGARLEGQADWKEPDQDGLMPAPPHDETGHTWHHPDTQLFLVTKYGTEALVGGTYKSNMVGFGEDLTDEEILQVLAFIKSTWPEQVIRRHNQINEAAGVSH